METQFRIVDKTCRSSEKGVEETTSGRKKEYTNQVSIVCLGGTRLVISDSPYELAVLCLSVKFAR